MIRSGRVAAGDLLPSVRSLSEKHGMAPKTVNRALKALAVEGLVVAEPRQGYRVLSRALDPDLGHPVAYVLHNVGDLNRSLDDFHQGIWNALHRAAAINSWSLLGIGLEEHAVGEAIGKIQKASAWGVLLDTVNEELLEMVRRNGMPAVMVDAWREDAGLDAVLQDNYQGGYLAAKHLIDQGHKQIAWIGPVGATSHSRERFGGAAAALAAAGLRFSDDLCIDVAEENVRPAGRKLLSRKNRPTAILSLWRGIAVELAGIARELGLVPEKDFNMVGWSTESGYREYAAAFPDGPTAPAIVWKLDDMAHTAIARLADRRLNPALPVTRLNVATELRVGEKAEG